MFPLRDENPKRSTPIITIGLIIVNITIFIFTVFSGNFQAIIYRFGLKPAIFLQGKQLETMVTSMFLHGGLLHVIGNMWFLWIFGDNVEDVCGPVRFIIFYLTCGAVAGIIHIQIYPTMVTPVVGASGAVSGILGAYLIMYPRARVVTFIPVFFIPYIIRVPSIFFLGFWFLYQLFLGSVTRVAGLTTSVAYWAHIGGFVAGTILIYAVRMRKPLKRV